MTSKFSVLVKRFIAGWFVLLCLAALTKSFYLSLAALFITGILPFAVFVLWLGVSEFGTRIRKLFEVWHIKTFAAAFIFIYGIYGLKWAGDTINELFNVDARYFGITTSLLTVLFTPFGLLYREELIGWTFNILTISSLTVLAVYMVILFIQWKLKRLLILFATITLASTALFLLHRIAENFKPAVKEFAVWADFNENLLCTDSWKSEAKGVVFLDDGNVLGYFPNSKEFRFKVVHCDYKREF